MISPFRKIKSDHPDIMALQASLAAVLDPLLKQGLSDFAEDSGVLDAYAVAPAIAPPVYQNGAPFTFKPATTNTGPATLSVNGMPRKAIVAPDGAVLAAGEILKGGIATLRFDGTSFRLLTTAVRHLPLTGGILTGNLGISVASIAPTDLGSLHVQRNIILGSGDANDSYIVGDGNLNLMAEANLVLVADSNDTAGAAASDIVFGAGSSSGVFGDTLSNYGTLPRNEFMRIAGATGNLGIGLIPASTHKLDIATNEASGFAAYFFNDGDNLNRYALGLQCGPDSDTGQQIFIRFFDGNGDLQGILHNTTGGAMQLLDVSDQSIKSDVVDAPPYDTRTIVQGLQLRNYSIRGSQGGKGFVAQEVEQVFPEMVTVDEQTGLLGVSGETPLTRVLLQSMKEQQLVTDQLTTRVEQLEASNAVLVQRVTALENAA